MKNNLLKIQNFALLVFFPFIAGCLNGGGGGGSDDFSNLSGNELFSGNNAINTNVPAGGTDLNITENVAPVIFSTGDAVGGEALAQITNPEPASLLLLGSGLVAMKYFKKKK